MSYYTYLVDDSGAVSIWPSGDQSEAPLIFQDAHPKGRPWSDKIEADAWAKNYIPKIGHFEYAPDTDADLETEELSKELEDSETTE